MKRNENKQSLTKKIVAGTGLALLLALVGYTGANTYAKYITEGQVASQTATVAKWGVVITADTNASGFGSDYTGGAKVSKDGVGVSASATVVAPGTHGSFTFTVSGAPEVSSKLSFAFADTFKDVHYGDYYPIVWTFTAGATEVVSGKLSHVVSTVKSTTYEYAPRQELGTHYTLSWSWAFDNSDANADKYDTYLGDIAAGNASSVPTKEHSTTVSFSLTAKVEQTQK